MPDDDRIENIDPFTKLWMFENWQADQIDDAELTKNGAYLIGSFINPEAVKKMIGIGANVYASSEDELEKSMEMVKNYKPQESSEAKPRRKLKA